VAQSVVTILTERIAAPGEREHLLNGPTLFEAARCVGDALREIHAHDAAALKAFGFEFNPALILGGQIRVARHISIDADNQHFASIRSSWSEALRHAFVQLPEPHWLNHR
jgi:predicted proteasome-type protease